jgi:hypothetical protein
MPDPGDPVEPPAENPDEIPGYAARRAQFLHERGLPDPPVEGEAPPEGVEPPAVALARQRRDLLHAYRQRVDALRPPAPTDGGGLP